MFDGTAVVASTVVGRSIDSEIVPDVAVISAVLASVVETSVVAVSFAVTSKVEADSTTVVASVLITSVSVLVNAAEEAEDRVKLDVADSATDSNDEESDAGVAQLAKPFSSVSTS